MAEKRELREDGEGLEDYRKDPEHLCRRQSAYYRQSRENTGGLPR